ncbi:MULTISPECIES: superoxide dismutase [Dialister]|uniref:Superoxide dismutase n=1 Tax=Dialister hominis TaxID=2582419 RepID=A0A8D4UTS4_9FIRM|nr:MULTISPECIES: superoxide dismutase [Dialister]HJI43151.1 superoxide dismutase [Veillonellaceae bacterium]MBS6412961.1 superoxide dismutase [Dialister sp.]MCH3912705.1 superoxide dismutase [Dialister sp.]MCH3929535.1 superoxide dismutase [Dialister sp.]MEE1348988.1 superoxide dismutase [Dialister hominis]
MAFELPALPYAYDALEPVIDADTMRFHHDKHHATYVANLNKALEAHPELFERSVEFLIAHLNHLPEDIKGAVRNNGGGTYNHTLFWEMMAPEGQTAFAGPVADKIKETFGSYEEFKKQFAAAAAGRFGSGWAWLVADGDKLEILSTANQDNPLTEGKRPLLCLDVWEHAYYLKYQNRRVDYINEWFRIINWDFVNEQYKKSQEARHCGK